MIIVFKISARCECGGQSPLSSSSSKKFTVLLFSPPHFFKSCLLRQISNDFLVAVIIVRYMQPRVPFIQQVMHPRMGALLLGESESTDMFPSLFFFLPGARWLVPQESESCCPGSGHGSRVKHRWRVGVGCPSCCCCCSSLGLRLPILRLLRLPVLRLLLLLLRCALLPG